MHGAVGQQVGQKWRQVACPFRPRQVHSSKRLPRNDLHRWLPAPTAGSRLRARNELPESVPLFPGTEGPRPFKVHFEAEIEVEKELIPPLVVTGEGASRTLTVILDPRQWLTAGPVGTDLSQFNGRLVEFEFELDRGVKIEIDD